MIFFVTGFIDLIYINAALIMHRVQYATRIISINISHLVQTTDVISVLIAFILNLEKADPEYAC